MMLKLAWAGSYGIRSLKVVSVLDRKLIALLRLLPDRRWFMRILHISDSYLVPLLQQHCLLVFSVLRHLLVAAAFLMALHQSVIYHS